MRPNSTFLVKDTVSMFHDIKGLHRKSTLSRVNMMVNDWGCVADGGPLVNVYGIINSANKYVYIFGSGV